MNYSLYFNKNRTYPAIDKRIKATFVKQSTAQKTKVYDMYARFYRWAMDRVDKNGIVAYITNRSFIDSRTFDGFRKIVEDNFQYAYIIDTKSDVRANPKIAGTTHNVFGIQTGVAVLFLVRKEKANTAKCEINYVALEENLLKEVKLDWFKNNPMQRIPFKPITPSKKHNWINLANNDFEELLLLAHDATHAKEAAFGELKRFEQRRVTVQEMRSKYINEKKDEINKEIPQSSENVSKGERNVYNKKSNQGFGTSYKHDENYQRQELNDY